MTELFEDNQRDLERAVENLGYLLEQNPEPDSIAKLRSDITNQSVSLTLYLLRTEKTDDAYRRMFRNDMIY
jgi:hypothetical protein